MNILAFDPGRTTGACLIDANKDGFQVIRLLEIPWSSRFGMTKALVNGKFSLSPNEKPQFPVAIVVESFTLRRGRAMQQSGSDFPSSQMIGTICAYAHACGILSVVHYQQPAMMARVKVLDQHASLVAGSEHKKDAYKHARYYYVTHRTLFE